MKLASAVRAPKMLRSSSRRISSQTSNWIRTRTEPRKGAGTDGIDDGAGARAGALPGLARLASPVPSSVVISRSIVAKTKDGRFETVAPRKAQEEAPETRSIVPESGGLGQCRKAVELRSTGQPLRLRSGQARAAVPIWAKWLMSQRLRASCQRRRPPAARAPRPSPARFMVARTSASRWRTRSDSGKGSAVCEEGSSAICRTSARCSA